MKKAILFFILLFVCWATMPILAQNPINEVHILPKPMRMTIGNKHFSISKKTQIVVPNDDESIQKVAQLLSEKFKLAGTIIPVVPSNKAKNAKNSIFFTKTFTKTDADSLGTEGYRLRILPTQINIEAQTAQGMFYALQTLFQLLPPDIYENVPISKKMSWKLPEITIEDKPRYSYRGLHLDVGRHFFPVSFIKKYIDLIAMHKFNTFHWHLTEDQGWRIEIKKYPKLTAVGSQRSETLVGHARDKPQKFDGKMHSGFYTQEEVREIVAYAQARFVTVVPEIEMPGHALAALASYPEYSCDSAKKYNVATTWGVFDDVFCPTEQTFSFLEDVLTEVISLFPSKYIHIGGDECPKAAWKKSAFCQDLIKKENLKDEHGLQSYFIRRIEKFLNSKGRNIIGWDEILEGGLAPNATVMSWRGTQGGITAAKEKHHVIMTPGTHCYFDHYQAESQGEPLAIGGFSPLEKVYSYEPTPDVLNETEAKFILGAQGNVWTEYLSSTALVEYMAYPRACALSEVLWSPKIGRNYDDFVARLIPHFKRLDRLKVNYSTRLYDVKIDLTKENNTPSVTLTSVVKNAAIRYTTDGSEPNITSILYAKPFNIQETTTVKSASFQNGQMISKVMSETFFIKNNFGMTYTFKHEPTKTYESGKQGLTNGRRGSENNFGQWVGFEGKDLEVVFDFGNAKTFKNIGIQFLNNPNSWVFLPDFVTVGVSDDGQEWTEMHKITLANDRTDKRYIKEVVLPITATTKPKRYMKIYAKNLGKCPKGHPAEGQKAWLFVDEILID